MSSKKWTYTTGGFPQCLHQTTFDPPAASDLNATQIQVRTKAFAINPVDVQAMNLYKTSSSPYPWPLSLLLAGSSGGSENQEHETCCDFSGTVTHAGSNAGFAPGDEVFGFTMAPMNSLGTAGQVLTFDTASASGVAIAKKPSNWDHTHAAAIPLVWLTARTSIEAVHSYVEQSKEKWLVVLGGSSSTGMYTVRIAKSRGWRVLSTCSTRNVDFVRNQLRADEVIDYTAVSSVSGEIFRKLQDPIQKGDGVVIVDCVGGTECLDDKDLGGKITRYITIVGDKTDRSSMGGPAIYANYPRMLVRWGLGRVGLGVSYDCVILEARKEWLDEAGQTLGKDEVTIDSTFAFDELPKALEKMVEGKVRGKLVGISS
ncbi:hypothetical protein N0V93_006869 [Gnomoniopsis smithogilvyi]|uniref:Enoyl reductase (ER) domain-containing protein n=1 Tax=Gnomoniopsis smithogilvyi TaxID=1191159 RepID=A0A9W8YQI1_9PEZI|nr:hypothetical protein N0V93_006869 [Gnomoniopsis smithogilvyi]